MQALSCALRNTMLSQEAEVHFSSNCHRALALCLSMFFFAKSAPIFSGHVLGMGRQDRSVMYSCVLA